MEQPDTDTDTAANRLRELLNYREHPVTGPEGHSYTAFQARTPTAASPALCDLDVVEQIGSAVAEVERHTRAANPDAGPLPAHVAAVYDWAREHTAHAPQVEQARRDMREYRHYLEHAIAAGDTSVVRPHRCPDCQTFGLFWPRSNGRNVKALVVCVNRHCADRNGGVSRAHSLARLAFEHVTAQKMLKDCAT